MSATQAKGRPMSNRYSSNSSSKLGRQFQPSRKGTPTTVLNSDGSPTTLVRLIQSQNQTRMKYETQRGVTQVQQPSGSLTVYHQWIPDYQKLIQRPQALKPMTKDPYTPLKGIVTEVRRSMVTEKEISLPLISPNAVKVNEVKIQTAPRRIVERSRPTIVRYLRRHELMPSEQSSNLLSANRLDIRSSRLQKSSILILNTGPQITPPPRLTPSERLLYRDKLGNDPALLRRPPRKINFSTKHETIIPLSIQT